MGEFEYEKLLKRAEEELPERVESEERYKIPAPKVKIQGNRTFIQNFGEICNKLGRDQSHLLKFFARELATSGMIDGQQAVYTGKFGYEMIKNKLLLYFRDFVKCGECEKPDTKFLKEERQLVIKCMACGAKHPVRGI